MKTKILMAIVVSLLVILVVSPGIPAGNKGQGTGRGNAKAPPEIEVVTFVNTPRWTSPPWYPPEAETNTYHLYKGGVRWASENPSLSCVVYTLGAPAGAFNAVEPAFAEWDDSTGADIYDYDNISEDSSGTPPGLAVDGSNTIFWGHIDGPGGVIATTQFVFWSNTKELIEFDIIFDEEEVWNADPIASPEPSDLGDPYPNTGQFDVWNVATHELGHTLVLNDLRSPRDGALTMHAYTWPGDAVKRTLGSGDELGIKAIYGD